MCEDNVDLARQHGVKSALVGHGDELHLGRVAQDSGCYRLAEVDIQALHLACRRIEVAESRSGIVGAAVQYAALFHSVQHRCGCLGGTECGGCKHAGGQDFQ
ncbi:hypothetical protein D3C72_1922340 [compost metagenome]